MQAIRFHLNISAERYLSYYKGSARQVIATSLDGRRVAFPAEHLRTFVTREGIRGLFELRFDNQNRFQELIKIET